MGIERIKSNPTSANGQKHEFSVYLVPRRTLVCEQVLEEEGVLGDITLGELALDLVVFEEDLLSLELQHTFKELELVIYL